MKRILSALILLSLGILACGRLVAAPQSLPLLTLTHDGLERSYILHVPPSYNESQSLPLVLAFHGGGGNAENQMHVSGLNQLADEKGFIVVFPNGSGRLGDKLLTWNGGGCCGYAQEHNIDDVGFVRALIAELKSEFNIDP